MNSLEREILELLKKGRDEYGFECVKCAFEGEAVRSDELLRYIELARKADLKLAIKIGGCTAGTDVLLSKQLGADQVICPMIESPYSLQKFLALKNRLYTADEREDTEFIYMIECDSAYQTLADCMKLATAPHGCDGVVFGRADFVGSRGRVQDREYMISDEITACAVATALSAKENGLEMVTGGPFFKDGEGFATTHSSLKTVAETYLTRFETLKIILGTEAFIGSGKFDETKAALGLVEAMRFEYLWEKNLENYYARISQEDATRIGVMAAAIGAA